MKPYAPAFTPECHDCGAVAEGARLEDIRDGIARMKYLCATCGPGFGGWATTVASLNNWIVLSQQGRGLYLMKRAVRDEQGFER